MGMDDIDWIFDTSREGTIPKGDGAWWLWTVKYWVISSILVCLATAAVVVTYIIHSQKIPPEFVFAIIMGVIIVLFCIFLVWMTCRRAVRRNREHKAKEMSLNREIAQYYRQKRQNEAQ